MNKIFLYLLTALLFDIFLFDDNNKNPLVDLSTMDTSFVYEITKASDNNVFKKQFYECEKCFLIKEVAEDLIKANQEFKKFGLRIKLYDCYRPLYIQRLLWQYFPDSIANKSQYIGFKSDHNRGCAVDIGLVDSSGFDVLMPTKYEYFGKECLPYFMDLPQEAIDNRELLKKIMEQNNFENKHEWWHFRHKSYNNYFFLNDTIKCE